MVTVETIGWLAEGELSQDDVIGAIRGRPCGGDDLSLEEARLLGYLVGDGSCTGTTPNITSGSKRTTDDILVCIKGAEFEAHVYQRPYQYRKNSAKYGHDHLYAGTLVKVSIKARERRDYKYKIGVVRQWVRLHGLEGRNSYTKRVPAAVMGGSDNVVRNFLAAYWSCDGWVTGRGVKRDGVKRDDIVVACASVNYDMIKDLQQLLWRIGISGRIRTKTANIPTKRQGAKYVSYTLEMADQDNTYRFASLINMAHEKNDKIRAARLRRFDFDHDIEGDVVVGIESIGDKACRCLTVEEDNSFVASGIAVHNMRSASSSTARRRSSARPISPRRRNFGILRSAWSRVDQMSPPPWSAISTG